MSESFQSSSHDVTPEKVALQSRRRWLALVATGIGVGVGGSLLYSALRPGGDDEVLGPQQDRPPGADLYPATRNPLYADAQRPLTLEPEAARYTNYYEFSSTKAVWRYVSQFRTAPWAVEIDGKVARPRRYDLDDLVHAFPLEDRIYRHRCVEAWAMVVPWTGFPLRALLARAEPLPEAKYVQFTTFFDPEQASRQQGRGMPWPYTEGLTLAEATNELTFLATGMYGHPLLKQHGAPLRLVVPWKYGFKSAKAIVRITLTTRQPRTFWNTLSPDEYGFEANVEPEVPHPRWSQATERMLGTGERRETLLYNGYGEWVGKLYRS